MFFSGDPRRRTVALYASALMLIFVALGAFQAFNTTLPVRIWHYSFNVDFLNPETAGETLLSTGLMVLVFLLLLLLLVLLLRNMLKLYAGPRQQRSGRAAALPHGSGRGADCAGSRGLHVSLQFSADEPLDGPLVFSEHVGVTRRLDPRGGGAGALCGQQCARRGGVDCRHRRGGERSGSAASRTGSHRITLDNGFVIVYDSDGKLVANFQAPPEPSSSSLIPWLRWSRFTPLHSLISVAHSPFNTAVLKKCIFFSPRFAARGRLRFKMARKPLRMRDSGLSRRLSPVRGIAPHIQDYEIGAWIVPGVSTNGMQSSG